MAGGFEIKVSISGTYKQTKQQLRHIFCQIQEVSEDTIVNILHNSSSSILIDSCHSPVGLPSLTRSLSIWTTC